MGKKLNINETNNFRNEKPLFQFITIISSIAFKIIHKMDSINCFLSVAVRSSARGAIQQRHTYYHVIPTCQCIILLLLLCSKHFWDLFFLNLNFYYSPHNQHIFPFSFHFYCYFINSFRIAYNECQSFSPSPPHLILSDSPTPSLLTTLSNYLWFFFFTNQLSPNCVAQLLLVVVPSLECSRSTVWNAIKEK